MNVQFVRITSKLSLHDCRAVLTYRQVLNCTTEKASGLHAQNNDLHMPNTQTQAM